MRWLGSAVVVACMVTVGCIDSDLVRCGDDWICAAGTACDFTHRQCVLPDQLTACEGQEAGTDCAAVPGGRCYDGVCLTRGCGNGLLDIESNPKASEACDDGNTLSSDGCSGDCKSTEICGNGIIDRTLERIEECDDGNALAHDGCSSSCYAEPPRWRELQPIPFRANHAMAYDMKRERVVLFGGGSREGGIGTGGGGGSMIYGDTWEWDGASWTQALPLTSPLARGEHSMVYAPTGEILLFGGKEQPDAFGDTWSWNGSRWTRLESMMSPPPTHGHAMAFDSKRARVVMHGGSEVEGGNATWIWNGEWSRLPDAPVGAAPDTRERHAMAYDPVRDQMVLFGGSSEDSQTWLLEGDTWRSAGFAPGGPTPRVDAVMAFDTVTNRVIMFGGSQVAGEIPVKDTWAWDGARWNLLAPTRVPPATTERTAMASDPRRRRLVLFGGDSTWGPDDEGPPPNATWEWDGNDWTEVVPPSTRPVARSGHAFAADPSNRTALLFGDDGGPVAETWLWDGSWRKLAVPSPPARSSASLAADTARGELVLFGGASTGFVPELHDTWVWNGSSWQERQTTVQPSARSFHASTFDAGRGELIVFGGSSEGTELDDIWIWNGASWSPRDAKGPVPRQRHAIAYDPVNRNTVLFGGTSNGVELNDTWLWNGTEWSAITPPVSPPSREWHTMTWDPMRRRIVLFGGGAGLSTSRNDLWEWDGFTWERVETPISPSARAGAAMVWVRGGLVLFGGGPLDCCGNILNARDDTWQLTWQSSSSPYETCSAVDTDLDAKVGCADPDCWDRCGPTCDPLAPTCDAAPRCGDGTCSGIESCTICSIDCGDCAATCGDLECTAPESSATCPGDCP